MVFDSLLCWPRTKAGEKVWQKCPDGVRGLDGENKSLINIVEIMCRNDELSSTMSWVGCLLKDLELFILFAENSQILLKISVIPILLTFIYLHLIC